MFSYLARENLALTLSAVGAGLFAIVGIAWGIWVDSLVILFDGAYSLVSLALSLLSLYAARLVRRPANKDYPFGLGAVEPLVIAVKGLVIALVCVISLISAVLSLFEGGRPVAADMGLLFGIINVVGCLGAWWYLRWSSRRNDSGLVRAEQRQWLMDSALSAAVMLGFAGAWMLERTEWASWSVYADPVMMIVISLYFMTVPVQMVMESVRELLLAAPRGETMDDVQDTLEELGLNPEQVKVAKLGPTLLLEARLIRI
ncbi:cation diffusion facilitator family transporter [Marinobacter daepoensis]|uniref:Cation diffusion facilitator family transporter n=1 Tax=Marinobacter daepoensis TaxID=262077 RepID=A0ABS3BDB3_9GAMM|nr:cation diffusion facilitator family transporter [Marinobacter daepoensis]MBN7768702.1 cation diffusion facilitator family transporter [Marinobacter daepoensis]MBY6032839.1 cation diffusion facilitator family transporter [Marinobacter daepoensis]MBY6079439.1 cation diffusion facilitator family transporter [Marinobacter daepoensis]